MDLIAFKSFGFSDAGKLRDRNEDRYLCNDRERLFLVADGMGGHSSGEMASELAIQSIEEFVVRSRSQKMRWPEHARPDLTPEQKRLLAGTVLANRRIFARSQQSTPTQSMGTTLVGAILENDHLAIVNVGDSRLYRIRDKTIQQITKDHSLVGEQERMGLLTSQEAKSHPRRHVLTRALGVAANPTVDVSLADVRPKDLFLFCSDGLYGMISEEDILATVHSIADGSLYKIGLSLVLKANLAGGKDNITVLLLHFMEK